MKILLRKPTIPYGLITTVFCLFVFVLGIALANRAHAEPQEGVVAAGDHLITLHDGGEDRGIVTSATTLRDAFKMAGVQIDPNDMVEPGLDETLVASHYDVNVYRARPVTVIDGSLRTKILSPYQTPEQIVKHAEITLQDEDETIVSANNDMVSQGAGLQVTIDRATPFTFVLYGKKVAAYTQGETVGEMLAQKDVKLAQNDMLSLPKSTPITAGMTVELWREGKQTITEEADVVFEVEKIQDGDREFGYKEVKAPGVVGKRTVSYEIEMKNGKEVSRKEIQSVTTKEPVKQVEIVGTKMLFDGSGTKEEWLRASGIPEDQWGYVDFLVSRESGWKPCSFYPSRNDCSASPVNACGLVMQNPCGKIGGDWRDPVAALKWQYRYVQKFGGYAGAVEYWKVHKSY